THTHTQGSAFRPVRRAPSGQHTTLDHSLSCSCSLLHTRTLSHSFSLTLSNTLSISLLSRSHTNTQTHTHTRTHTLVVSCESPSLPPRQPSLTSLYLSFCFTLPQYGIVLDAGSSHTSMYIYKWPADKLNDTGVVSQHSEYHVKG